MAESYSFSENIGYLLNRCAAEMAARFEKELAPFDISLAQWGAMLAIHEKGEASPSDIASRVGIDRGAATRLIARMEAKRIVQRRTHDVDGRSVILSLSPAAKAKMPQLLVLSKQVNREALAILPHQEAEAFQASLTRLLDGLQR